MDSSTYKTISIIIGSIVGLILAGIIIGVSNRKEDGKLGKFEYDERQERFNGKSFKYGFLTMVVYSALLTIIGLCKVTIPAIEPVIYFSVLFVGTIAMSSYSIWTDSYWGMRTNKKCFYIFMLICTLINLIVPIRFIIAGEFLEDGKIGATSINLMCGIAFLSIFVQDIIRSAIAKKEDEE